MKKVQVKTSIKGRVVGYYGDVKDFNDGKKAEFAARKYMVR